MKGAILANANLMEAMLMTKMETNLGIPFLTNFASLKEYRKLKRVVSEVESKVLVKYLNALSSFDDYTDETVKVILLKEKMRKFLIATNKHAGDIINIFKKYSNDIHGFEMNLPILSKDIIAEDYYKFIVALSKYEKSMFFKVLQYSNYKNVREFVLEKKNKSIIEMLLNKITISNVNRNKSLELRKKYGEKWRDELEKEKIKKSRSECSTYVSGYKIPGLEFIKDRVLADFWGKETLCCLKIGGAASKLLDVIEYSPIAGELVGKVNNKKISSFVWDMVEIEEGVAKKTLILDNIEANVRLDKEETMMLLNNVSKQEGYKNIYLGTVRNDVTLPESILNLTKNRQSKVVGYEMLDGFSFADSSVLHTVSEKEDDTKFSVRKMKLSDLHNVKYIEKILYPGCDEELLNNIELNTPCYVVDSKTHIAGYFLTRYKYFKSNETDFHQDNEVKWYNMESNKKYKKKLYIEDLFLMNNRKIKASLKSIIEGFVDFCKENHIDSVMMNPNDNSRPLIKRLEDKGISIELEKLETIKPSSSLHGTIIVSEVENEIC